THDTGTLRAVRFPESIVYVRGGTPPARSAPPAGFAGPSPPRAATPAALPPHGAARAGAAGADSAGRMPAPPQQFGGLQREAEAAFGTGEYVSAAARAEAILAQEPASLAAVMLAAQSYANLGDLDRAADCCRKASRLDPLAVPPYRLLASVAEERRDLNQAERLVTKGRPRS